MQIRCYLNRKIIDAARAFVIMEEERERWKAMAALSSFTRWHFLCGSEPPTAYTGTGRMEQVEEEESKPLGRNLLVFVPVSFLGGGCRLQTASVALPPSCRAAPPQADRGAWPTTQAPALKCSGFFIHSGNGWLLCVILKPSGCI